MSENKGTSLAAKLAEVMAEVGYVQKDGKNEHQRYTYPSAKAVLMKVNAALSKRNISLESEVDLLRYEPGKTPKGTDMQRAVVKITLVYVDGDNPEVRAKAQGLGEGSDSGDKSVMKANTAALKYVVSNSFLISWGDDPEADETVDKMLAETSKPKSVSKTGPATSKKTSSQDTAPTTVKAPKESKSEDTPETILADIGKASLEELDNKLRERVLAFKHKEGAKADYDKMVAAFKARTDELKAA